MPVSALEWTTFAIRMRPIAPSRTARCARMLSGTKRWFTDTGGTVDSSPAVYNGAVFVQSHDGMLWSFDATTGAERWSVSLGGGPSSPTVAGGMVFVTTEAGEVAAVDPADGSVLWSANVGSPIRSSPSVINGGVYFGADNGTVYAFGL